MKHEKQKFMRKEISEYSNYECVLFICIETLILNTHTNPRDDAI